MAKAVGIGDVVQVSNCEHKRKAKDALNRDYPVMQSPWKCLDCGKVGVGPPSTGIDVEVYGGENMWGRTVVVHVPAATLEEALKVCEAGLEGPVSLEFTGVSLRDGERTWNFRVL